MEKENLPKQIFFEERVGSNGIKCLDYPNNTNIKYVLSEWIDVNERMPEINETNFSDRVLVITDFGYSRVTEYDNELKKWCGLIFQQVTHWMPLPPPPTKGV